MHGVPGEGPNTVQHFGNAEATNGALQFQGIVKGDLTINQRSIELHDLPPASFNDASKQHVPLCLPGTRHNVLEQIRKWADGHGERRIYWLKGMAGTGKSTIALTIAREYFDKGLLAGSFFFSRGGGDLASVQKFSATIAGQLREISQDLRRRIDDAIASNPRVHSFGLYDQWEKLVLQPLSKQGQNPFSCPLVLVVDALDECNNEDDVRLLIQCLAAVTTNEGIQLRVFVTSRPEQPIKLGFDSISKEMHLDIVLHDIEQSIVDHDLYLYYKDRLNDIISGSDLNQGDISEPNIQRLVRKSAGLFIHAATVCRFIRGGGQLASERLSLLLDAGTLPIGPEKELDKMYSTVLSYSLPRNFDNNERTKLRNWFCRIIGSIVLLFDAMSPESLAMMLNEPKSNIDSTFNYLRSVLDIPEQENKPVRILHPSFRDFLLDPERCSNQIFLIDVKETHYYLFECCLRIMSGHLRRNMCNIQQPGTRASSISKFEADKNIPLPVQYACRYWIYHLQRSNLNPTNHSGIYDFFQTRFLYWLEALALINRVSDGITMMKVLEEMLPNAATTRSSNFMIRVKSKWKEIRPRANETPLPLFRIVYDAKRFFLSHASIIEEAPLQIYYSALIFSPEASTTRQQYSSQVPGWVLQKPDSPKNWSPHLQTLSHSSAVKAVAFSPDGKLVASGSGDETVRLWDTTTGAERRVLKGHSSWVNAVAFSPDGKLVASGSYDKTGRLWDATTGAERRVLKGHSASVNAVAFSPDSKLVASSSDDMTVRLWDSTTGAERRVLKGHSSRVNAVAFSPDGELVASGSSEKTVRLWDGTKGAEQRVLKGHSSSVNAVAFSPDGKLVASGSFDETVRLWASTTGAERRVLKGHSSWVDAVAFSPDGKVVASGSVDETVRLWDTTTGAERRVLKGHSSSVNAVAFSPDGKLVASGSGDKTVRLWDATKGAERRVLKGHSSSVNDVAFSPDGKLVAFSSSDKTVRLWDATTGAERRVLKGHSGSVDAVAFSPDGELVASNSADMTVRLWDATTGAERRVLRGHSDWVTAVAFSPDGKLVASGSFDETVRLWDSTTGAERRVLRGHSNWVKAVAFSPDGKLVASGSNDKTVRLWDATTGAERRVLKGHSSSVNAVAFSPDGKLVASGSGDKTVRLWDATTGAEQRVLKGHSFWVGAVAFSPDGKLVASNSADMTVRLWDATTGAERHMYNVGVNLRFLYFSPCGKYLITDRGTLRLSELG